VDVRERIMMNQSEKDELSAKRLQENLSKIKNTILVLSGKGGVGKSTVATNIAISLAKAGKKVGLMDIDIHGPSIPIILGMENEKPQATAEEEIIPINYQDMLKVISIGFLLDSQSDAVIWRGPLKHGVIRQFLSDVKWGELDYLIVDSPPGTGDEPLSIAQMLGKGAKAVLVTTPQKVSTEDVRKSITFCRQLNLEIIGIVENMAGFVCPECGKETKIFKSGGGKYLEEKMNVKLLGSIPIDPAIVETTDDGVPYLLKYDASPASEEFAKVIKPLLTLDK
jgi:Mrp family chromosome partitioning ATPase